MISDLLLDVVFGIVSGIIALFPSYSLPAGPGFTVFAAANVIIPFDVLFFWLGVTVACGIAGMVYWSIMVIVNLIRGAGA